MIDEIDLVRQARPADPPHDPAVKSRAWARLHAEFDAVPARRRSRRGRVAWRLAATGVVAAGAAATIVVVQPGGGTPVKAPQTGGDPTVRMLEMAAKTVENQTVARPRPNQWIYVPQLLPSNAPWARNGKEKREQWWRFDGSKTADIDPKKGTMTVRHSGLGGDDRSPRQFYDYVNGLPTDPGALFTRIRRDSNKTAGNDQNERAFKQIFVIFRDAKIVPPKVNAALYRVLAEIPGVRIINNVTDLAGRHGIAVTRNNTDVRDELILDPRTYRIMGERAVAIRNVTFTATAAPGSPQSQRIARPPRRAGEILINVAFLPSRTVDKPGQRS